MYLLINIAEDEIESYTDISSIDEVAHSLKATEDGQEEVSPAPIPPETEFMGHCSNIQAWADNNYDTRILHSNIAFPLLKKLVEAGDPIAKKVFKEEIAQRFGSGFPPTLLYLINNHYLDYLDKEEQATLFENIDFSILGNYGSENFLPLLTVLYKQGVVAVKPFYLPYVYSILDGEDLKNIYDIFLTSQSATLLTKEEYADLVLYFLDKMSDSNKVSFYPTVLSYIIRELEALNIKDEGTLRKIYALIFSQITYERDQEWSDLIFLILECSRGLNLFSFLISEFSRVFEKLNCNKRGEIFIYIFTIIKHEKDLNRHFELLSNILKRLLVHIGEINTIYDAGYLFADLLLALHKTPLLRAYKLLLNKSLKFILENLKKDSFGSTATLMNTLIDSIYYISNKRIRNYFIKTVKTTTNYDRVKHLMAIKRLLIMNPVAIERLMKANGMKHVEIETVLALIDYLETLASEVIKNAYNIARHAGEKIITIKSMKIAMSLIVTKRRLIIDFEY